MIPSDLIIIFVPRETLFYIIFETLLRFEYQSNVFICRHYSRQVPEGKADYLGFICETVEESLETPLYGNKTFSNANPITDMTISICSPTQVHIFRRITFSTFMNIDQLKAKKVSSHGNFMEVIFINFTYSAKIYHS